MNEKELQYLLDKLVNQPSENEWVEFKKNFHSFEEIGEDISALANGACLNDQPFSYLVFGVEDETHKIIGTNFEPKTKKKGNEILENWLSTRLQPKIDFKIIEFDYSQNLHIAIFKIPAAKNTPITFLKKSYVRVGSVTRELHDFPDKAAKIWKQEVKNVEKEIVKEGLDTSDVLKLLSAETYFDLMKIPAPSTQQGVMDKLLEENLIKEDDPESKSRKYASYLGDYPLIHKKTRCHPELVEG